MPGQWGRKEDSMLPGFSTIDDCKRIKKHTVFDIWFVLEHCNSQDINLSPCFWKHSANLPMFLKFNEDICSRLGFCKNLKSKS